MLVREFISYLFSPPKDISKDVEDLGIFSNNCQKRKIFCVICEKLSTAIIPPYDVIV